ncbi:MAG TPA: ATP-binding protein [Vicinamibacterales bacterium]|nr:ATP-binding protein [Vicinamibacterales bacterium]
MLDLHWVLEALPVGVWVAQVPSGQVAYANPEFRKIMGMDPVAASSIRDAPATYGIFDLDGRPYPVDRLPFSRVVMTGGAVTVDDLVIHRADGRKVNVRAFAYPLSTNGGDLTHVLIAFIDITAEMTAEAERRQTESRLALAVNHAPIAIWAADATGVVTLSEGAGLASLGVKSGDLVGKNLFDLYKDHPSIPGFLRRALAGESFSNTVQVGEAVFETWMTPLTDAAGVVTGMAGLSNDVTALRKFQANAIQNDRVIALGTLAASVAHEINNPLTYILGHLDFLGESLNQLDWLTRQLVEPARREFRDLADVMRESLEPVRAGTERIASITRDLRTFSRPSTGMALVDVQAAVASVLKLIGKELESRAEVEVDLRKTSPVRGDSARLVQVILNLVVNAMQALPDDRSRTNRVSVSAADEGDAVVIEVTDNGPGVPPEDRERIFEPFQTTKEVGDGSGLGLFVCRSIVNAWSGTVTVDDRPGGGARFRVVLPIARDAAAPPAPAVLEPPRVAAHARGHVMVVDDDPPVANVLRAQLEAAGYRVTLETEAARALERLTSASEGIDLVYCDLMMTGMSGMDFADALAARAPAHLDRVVFMTGGAFTSRAREFRNVRAARCVDKPFDVVTETACRLDGRRQD